MTCDFLTPEGYHEGLYKTVGSAVHAHRSCLLPFTCLPVSVLTEVHLASVRLQLPPADVQHDI